MTKGARKTGAISGLRLVAVLEALKGILVLLAGCGVLALIHRNAHQVAVEMVKVLHMNPARHYPVIFIDAASRVTSVQLWMLALSALAYSMVRLAEAYGLWTHRQWAQWFGLLSGAIYLPLELYEVWRGPTWPRITVFMVNLAVVGLLTVAVGKRGRSGRRSR